MDADTVQWPLILRHWEPGDRFQPLGMIAQKKLQDFFTDARVPRSRRHAIPILADQEKICWVLGYRLDARVRLTEKTKRVLLAEKQSF
jgi:tRNA(Ile)-lysidine synthase